MPSTGNTPSSTSGQRDALCPLPSALCPLVEQRAGRPLRAIRSSRGQHPLAEGNTPSLNCNICIYLIYFRIHCNFYMYLILSTREVSRCPLVALDQ